MSRKPSRRSATSARGEAPPAGATVQGWEDDPEPAVLVERPAPDLSLIENDERTALFRALSPVPQDRFPTCVELMNQLLKALRLEVVREPERGMKVRPTPDSVTRSNLRRAMEQAKLSKFSL